MIHFQAFDTETINKPGRGEACLLIKMAPTGPVFYETPKSWQRCFNFLASRPASTYVAYNMNFDARAICHPRFVNWRHVERLGLFGRVEFGPFRLSFIANKFFEARHIDGRKFIIYDLAQFFGMSLARASKKYLPGLEKLEIPKSWYLKMDEVLADPKRRPRLIAYALRDVEAPQALVDLLLKSLGGIGLRPRRLSSCATLARIRYGKILERVKAPDYINHSFQRGYYGGRIETSVLGVVGRSRLYDINSAYPSVIAGLIDPTSGHHEEVRDCDGPHDVMGVDYGLYFVSAQVPRHYFYGPLAVKHLGTIHYPVGNVGTWVCKPALEYLRRYKIPYQIRYGYEIKGCSRKPLFVDIDELYRKRKNSDIGLAIKLLLNSIYGLLAEQSDYYIEDLIKGREVSGHMLRRKHSFGRLTNYVLAAHITEAVRMKVWEIMHKHGKKVYFAATDSVLVSPDVTLTSSLNLGDWSLKGEFESGVVLGCGRYYLKAKDPEEDMMHLRGFPVHKGQFDKLSRCKKRHAWLRMKGTQSLRQWSSNLLADDFNVLSPEIRKFSVDDNKRYWKHRYKTLSEYFTKQSRSLPYIVGIA